MTEAEHIIHRAEAEKQRDDDLKKDLTHLVADVHDEAARTDRAVEQNLVHVLKRFAPLLAVAATEANEYHKRLEDYTKTIIKLTAALKTLTWVLIGIAILGIVVDFLRK